MSLGDEGELHNEPQEGDATVWASLLPAGCLIQLNDARIIPCSTVDSRLALA